MVSFSKHTMMSRDIIVSLSSPYFYFCIYFWLSILKGCICVGLACQDTVQWKTISEEWSVFVLIPGCIVLWLNHVIWFQNVSFCFQIVRNVKVYSKCFSAHHDKVGEACAIPSVLASITYYTWMLNLSQRFEMPEEYCVYPVIFAII